MAWCRSQLDHRALPSGAVHALACAILLVTACSDLGPRQTADIVVSYHGYYGPSVFRDSSLLRADLRADGTNYQVRVADLGMGDGWPVPHTATLTLPANSTLQGDIAVVSPVNDTLARATVSFAIQRDYHYGITIMPGGARPVGLCVGNVIAAPLRRPGTTTVQDTLWIMYGGLPDGAIC